MASILLVDTDPSACLLVRGFLERGGHEVSVVADGESALEAVRHRRVDVVVTEILVPRVDGLALCRRLKGASETARMPVVVMSILAAASRSREAGADAFLKKPVTQARVLDVVRGVLGLEPVGTQGTP